MYISKNIIVSKDLSDLRIYLCSQQADHVAGPCTFPRLCSPTSKTLGNGPSGAPAATLRSLARGVNEASISQMY